MGTDAMHVKRMTFVLGGGVTVAAMGASGASAAVVATSTDILLDSYNPEVPGPHSQTVALDINADGVDEFNVTHTSEDSLATPKVDVNGLVTLTPATVSQYTAVVEDTGADGLDMSYAEDLDIGATVGPSDAFISLNDPSYDPRLLDHDDTDSVFDSTFSVFTDEVVSTELYFGPKYAGIAFGDESSPFYGYIEFNQITNDHLEVEERATLRITGFAYESVAGTSITIVPIAPIPEPGTLALVAAGCAAIGWRRRDA